MSIAVGIACSIQPAWALRVELRPDPLPPGYVERYFTGDVMIDGLPVFREGHRIWTGYHWMPLIEAPKPRRRPIPKRQRRME